jgi:hypoxanthine phosphoribosyltransferase
MCDKHYKPDVIIGLLRGGIIPARIFADFFNVKMDFFALDVKLYTGINERDKKPVIRHFDEDIKGKKILIVDDIWDSGTTMKAVLEYLKNEDIQTVTLYWKETADQKPTYYSYVAKEEQWIVFPWEKTETKNELRQAKSL